MPHVACRTESRRQSPAVRFHRAYRRLSSLVPSSNDQLMMGDSSSSSNNNNNNKKNCCSGKMAALETREGTGWWDVHERR